MYSKELVIPENVNMELNGNKIKISGPKGALEKRIEASREIKIEKSENKLKVSSESDKKKVKAMVGTVIAHARNMIEGVTKGFTYRLKVVYSHFPVTIKVEKDKVLVQNFLGERNPRVAPMVDGVDVKAEGTDITITGMDKDKVSMMAGRLEQVTRITKYDRKIFQDGIYIVSGG
jgi:large subunit ribosomal protein L6